MATPPVPTGPRTTVEPPAEVLPIAGAVYVAGPPFLLAGAGAVLLPLLLVGPFVVILTLAVAIAAVAGAIALVAAVLASPYLLVRHLRGRHRPSASPAGAATASPLAPVPAPRGAA